MTPSEREVMQIKIAQIILAEQFGGEPDSYIISPECDDDKAALKSADAILPLIEAHGAEVREACVKVAEKLGDNSGFFVAAAIRSQGEK